jgi:hypothetical protein
VGVAVVVADTIFLVLLVVQVAVEQVVLEAQTELLELLTLAVAVVAVAVTAHREVEQAVQVLSLFVTLHHSQLLVDQV